MAIRSRGLVLLPVACGGLAIIVTGSLVGARGTPPNRSEVDVHSGPSLAQVLPSIPDAPFSKAQVDAYDDFIVAPELPLECGRVRGERLSFVGPVVLARYVLHGKVDVTLRFVRLSASTVSNAISDLARSPLSDGSDCREYMLSGHHVMAIRHDQTGEASFAYRLSGPSSVGSVSVSLYAISAPWYISLEVDSWSYVDFQEARTGLLKYLDRGLGTQFLHPTPSSQIGQNATSCATPAPATTDGGT